MTTLWWAWWGCAELPEDPSIALGACDVAEVEQQAARNGFMLTFGACGSNNVADATWSVTGHELYYQLGMTQHILLADTKDHKTLVLPTPTPTGPATWVVRNDPTTGKSVSRKVVHPVGPDAPEGPERLATWDLDEAPPTEGALPPPHFVSLPAGLGALADLGRTRDPDRVLLSAVKDGVRRAYTVSLVDGTAEEAWTWLGPVDTVTYTPAADRVVSVKAGTATVWDTVTGRALGTWSPALRGTVHPKGRWLVLEHEGEAVSVFGPNVKDLAELEAKLPPDAPRTVKPPMLSFVNLETGDRFQLEAIQGSDFEWYEITDYYGSFVSWGFDKKQARRNVVLGDLLERLTGSEIDALVGQTKKVGEKEGFLHGGPADAPSP